MDSHLSRRIVLLLPHGARYFTRSFGNKKRERERRVGRQVRSQAGRYQKKNQKELIKPGAFYFPFLKPTQNGAVTPAYLLLHVPQMPQPGIMRKVENDFSTSIIVFSH